MRIRHTPALGWIWLSLLLCSAGAWADAALVSDKSGIRFISVKNAAVAEVHHFRNLSGVMDDEGHVNITIPLVNVETLIPIRNERMREMFFETGLFPSAEIETDIDMVALGELKSGDYTAMKVLFRLELHGKSQMLETTVGVSRLGDEIHVGTLEPLVLNTANYGLLEGVDRLRKVAGLKSIATAVPVTANLVFQL